MTETTNTEKKEAPKWKFDKTYAVFAIILVAILILFLVLTRKSKEEKQRDWTQEEMKKVGEGLDRFMQDGKK